MEIFFIKYRESVFISLGDDIWRSILTYLKMQEKE